MKKLMAMLAAMVMLITASAALADQSLLEEIQQRGTMVVATEGNWSPWTYHEKAGEPLTGFDIEIANLIAQRLGVTAEFQEVPWESILAGVDQGRFDIACNGVDYTEERAEKFAFTDPYVYTEAVLVVRKDNEDIHTIEDLAGKTTSNSPNSTYAQMAEAAGSTVAYVDTLGETMMMLEQGRAEATLNAKGSVEDYLREHPDANIKIVLTMPGAPVCYPLRKAENTETLLEAINGILAQLREEGILSELSVKYFGQDLTERK